MKKRTYNSSARRERLARHKFDEEFKQQALTMIGNGQSVCSVAEALRTGKNLLNSGSEPRRRTNDPTYAKSLFSRYDNFPGPLPVKERLRMRALKKQSLKSNSIELLARTVRGTEWIGAAEIEGRMKAKITSLQHREIRFQVQKLETKLLEPGSVDDVFLIGLLAQILFPALGEIIELQVASFTKIA